MSWSKSLLGCRWSVLAAMLIAVPVVGCGSSAEPPRSGATGGSGGTAGTPGTGGTAGSTGGAGGSGGAVSTGGSGGTAGTGGTAGSGGSPSTPDAAPADAPAPDATADLSADTQPDLAADSGLDGKADSGAEAKPAEPPRCGDGMRNQADEECDRGRNNIAGTYGTRGQCSKDCKNVDFCGDKAVNPPVEECDNGDLNGKTPPAGMPACNVDCKKSVCGNGRTEVGEECDNGNANGKDAPGGMPGCSADCKKSACGNGKVELGEECDNGNTNGKAPPAGLPACNNDCTKAVCGNGKTEAGEECDDGGNNSKDKSLYSSTAPSDKAKGICNADCKKIQRFCGDGTIDKGDGEICETAQTAAPITCKDCKTLIVPVPEAKSLPVTDIHVDGQAVCQGTQCAAAIKAANSPEVDATPLEVGCLTPDATSFANPTFIFFDKLGNTLAEVPETKVTLTLVGGGMVEVECFVDTRRAVPVPGQSPFVLPKECLGREGAVKIGLTNKDTAVGSCLTVQQIKLDTQVVNNVTL